MIFILVILLKSYSCLFQRNWTIGRASLALPIQFRTWTVSLYWDLRIMSIPPDEGIENSPQYIDIYCDFAKIIGDSWLSRIPPNCSTGNNSFKIDTHNPFWEKSGNIEKLVMINTIGNTGKLFLPLAVGWHSFIGTSVIHQRHCDEWAVGDIFTGFWLYASTRISNTKLCQHTVVGSELPNHCWFIVI